MVGFTSSLAALTPDTKNMGVAFTIIGPFFVGFIELASLALAPLFCKASDIGLASGLLASIRSAGGAIAVAVYSTILSNRLTTTIPAAVVPAATDAGLPASKVPQLLAALDAGTLDKFPAAVAGAVGGALPGAYAAAFKTVYLASIGFGAIAIIGSLLSKDAKEHLTDRVERKMHNSKDASKV
jgi:hypothetical protein